MNKEVGIIISLYHYILGSPSPLSSRASLLIGIYLYSHAELTRALPIHENQNSQSSEHGTRKARQVKRRDGRTNTYKTQLAHVVAKKKKEEELTYHDEATNIMQGIPSMQT